MSFQKAPALRNDAYLAWVRTQPSVESGKLGCIAHHVIGHGRLSSLKTSDYLAIPLTDEEHRRLHDRGWPEWEETHGSQLEHAARVMESALRYGILTFDARAAKEAW